MAHQEASLRAILYALLANLGIAIAKSWAAVFTGSGSMLAEAVHSYADVGNQVLLFVGLRQSRRAADAEHPLGYGKLSYFWSFIVALLLFSLGGLFSIYEGFHKLAEPQPLSQIWVALLVLGVAIVLESFSLYGALREVNALRGGKSLLRWLQTTRNAELVVILGEDVAALVGLTLAFLFLGLTWLTGNLAYDAAGSIAIGLVLVAVSLFVALRIRSLIVGRSAEPEVQEAIGRIIREDPAIEALLNTITLQLGPKVMLAAKVRLQSGMSIEEAVARINALELRLKSAVPDLGWCFIEPEPRTDRGYQCLQRIWSRRARGEAIAPVPALLNFVLFYVVWFLSLQGAASGRPWLGPLALLIFLAVQLRLSRAPRVDAWLAALAAVGGLIFDTLYIQLGLMSYASPVPFAAIAPYWILGMWANFGLTLNSSLGWLQGRWVLAALFGAIGGPLAYLTGLKIGAATFNASPVVVYAALALAWGTATPILLGFAQRLSAATARNA